MNDEEHQELVARFKSGSLLIGIDPRMARKLYTDVSLSVIEEETGETLYFDKIVVLGALLFGPLSLLASFVMASLAFGLWAAIIIPISIVIYVLYSSISSGHHPSMPKQGMFGVSILLALALLSLFFNWFPSRYLTGYAVLILFALWNARLVYFAATYFMRAFVVRNRRAYELLAPNIHLKDI